MVSTEQILDWLVDANQRTHAVYLDLSEEQQIGPQIQIVNPPRWEVGHVAWFTENWVLRHALGREPILANCDAWYDSIAIAHHRRWVLDLPTWDEAHRYLDEVDKIVAEELVAHPDNKKLRYFARYAIYHHDMHNEAFAYTRQTLGYPPPPCLPSAEHSPVLQIGDKPPGDRNFPAGTIMVGASRDDDFVFDNEKWEHRIAYDEFAMSCSTVTQQDFLEFVEDGGYEKQSCWDVEGRNWLEQSGAKHPVYWRRGADGSWQRRWFDRLLPLDPVLPVVHVSWHEANAFCRWAGRRLPTEVEWEVAAAAVGPDCDAGKRRYPWGNAPCGPQHANLDWQNAGCVPVTAYPQGTCPAGVQQLLGNVWEWTSSAFLPYPGFVPDPYKDYSEPWFGTHKVLRGGAWCTMSRMMRNTLRNFYEPHRRDVWAGFRTCKASA